MLTQERNSAVEALELDRSACQEREKKLLEEMQELQHRINDLDAQNSILHNQIQELSDKTAIMHSQQSRISGRESPDTSLEAMNRSFSEDDSKSAEQLLRVLKYLRREKDLAVAKFDVLRAENLRLKSQVEVSIVVSFYLLNIVFTYLTSKFVVIGVREEIKRNGSCT